MDGLEHVCKKFEEANKGLTVKDYGYGPATFDSMIYVEANKRWWMDNGEYASPIIYCPYCGIKLDSLLRKHREQL